MTNGSTASGEVDAADLTFDEAIDRDLLIASLTERAIYDEWEIWRRNPDAYMNPGLDGVFILFLHRLRPEAELVRERRRSPARDPRPAGRRAAPTCDPTWSRPSS